MNILLFFSSDICPIVKSCLKKSVDIRICLEAIYGILHYLKASPNGLLIIEYGNTVLSYEETKQKLSYRNLFQRHVRLVVNQVQITALMILIQRFKTFLFNPA